MSVSPAGPTPPGRGPLTPPRAVSAGERLSLAANLAHQQQAATRASDAAASKSLLTDVVREALAMGHPQQALELLDRIWSRDVTREDAWFLRGQALYELQRYLEAGQVTQQGIQRNPRSAALYYLLCNCETQLNHLEAAEVAIRSALGLLPENGLLRARYAHLLVRLGRLDEAREQLDLADVYAPGHPIVGQERKFLAAVTSGPSAAEEKVSALLHEATDPYARAPLGLSLLPVDERLLPPGEGEGEAEQGVARPAAGHGATRVVRAGRAGGWMIAMGAALVTAAVAWGAGVGVGGVVLAAAAAASLATVATRPRR